MFFLHDMERVISLHPQFFDKDTQQNIIGKLHSEYEGTNTGNFYVICIVKVIDCSEPRVLPGSAWAEFTVVFQALVWRPFKGEVCDGVVSSVVSNGFFVEVGPLNVFVSKAMIPSEFKYDANATPAQFTNNADINILRGTSIRIKIKGIRGEKGQMYAIATIREDFLGVV